MFWIRCVKLWIWIVLFSSKVCSLQCCSLCFEFDFLKSGCEESNLHLKFARLTLWFCVLYSIAEVWMRWVQFSSKICSSVFYQIWICDKSQHMCRVLGPASRAELLRDRYFNRLEIELGSLGLVSEDENIDWLEPSLFPYNPRMLQDDGFDRVYYAIHLLQTDPSVQVQSMVSDSIFMISVYKKNHFTYL